MINALRVPINKEHYLYLVLPFFLIVHLILAFSSVQNKSNTFDELPHLTAGYSYWAYNDYRLHPENGNLPQRWAALPLLALNLNFPSQSDPHWLNSNAWFLGNRFFFKMGNNIEEMLHLGRLMIIIISLATGGLVWYWSYTLFGPKGGILSLFLYTFSPSVLAHARLITSDMTATFFFLLAVGMIWKTLRHISLLTLLGTGLAIGGLMVSKVSAVIILPIACILIIIKLLRNTPLTIKLFAGKRFEIIDRGAQAISIAGIFIFEILIVFMVIWSFYGFRYSAIASDHSGGNKFFSKFETELPRTGPLKPFIMFMRENKLLPEAFLYGFTFTISYSKNRRAFLLGEHRLKGWWYFFPVCFLLKTPLTVLLLAIVSVATYIFLRNKQSGDAWIPLIVLLSVYWAFALTSNLNIGSRHILITYPILFILMGNLIYLLPYAKKYILILPFLCVTFFSETFMIWPHYLAFFNALAGGSQKGYQSIVDSSLDWGQDLPGLKQWITENQASLSKPIYLSYFGTSSPEYYDIHANYLPCFFDLENRNQQFPFQPLKPGYYCISATMFQQVYIDPQNKWNKNYGSGIWNPFYEQRYWSLLQQYSSVFLPESFHALMLRSGNEPSSKPVTASVIGRFRELQFARLCYYLAHRSPDHMVGYSILIFDLAKSDIDKALYGHLQNLSKKELKWFD